MLSGANFERVYFERGRLYFPSSSLLSSTSLFSSASFWVASFWVVPAMCNGVATSKTIDNTAGQQNAQRTSPQTACECERSPHTPYINGGGMGGWPQSCPAPAHPPTRPLRRLEKEIRGSEPATPVAHHLGERTALLHLGRQLPPKVGGHGLPELLPLSPAADQISEQYKRGGGRGLERA